MPSSMEATRDRNVRVGLFPPSSRLSTLSCLIHCGRCHPTPHPPSHSSRSHKSRRYHSGTLYLRNSNHLLRSCQDPALTVSTPDPIRSDFDPTSIHGVCICTIHLYGVYPQDTAIIDTNHLGRSGVIIPHRTPYAT